MCRIQSTRPGFTLRGPCARVVAACSKEPVHPVSGTKVLLLMPRSSDGQNEHAALLSPKSRAGEGGLSRTVVPRWRWTRFIGRPRVSPWVTICPMTAPTSVYVELTRAFNRGRCRAVLCSGQAVVLHRLSMMSKDGDWIVRENPEDLQHILLELQSRGAVYRCGAPLDIRWLRHGWSSHLEFRVGGVRIRVDFFTRPPRLPFQDVQSQFDRGQPDSAPFVDLVSLARMKMTDREKDWPIIGELARRMEAIEDRVLWSRSARELLSMRKTHPGLFATLVKERPLLGLETDELHAWEAALDRERRDWMHRNEERLAVYARASEKWRLAWMGVDSRMQGHVLVDSHRIMVDAAEQLLPQDPHPEAGSAPQS